MMNQLQYICLEVISKNLSIYSKISDKYNHIKFSNTIGEKIFQSYLTHFNNEYFNENGLEFIIHHSSIQNFYIFPKLYNKIESFDFLNRKYFDKLEICLVDKLVLKNDEQFSLTVNELIFSFDTNYLIESKSFLENFQIKKSIEFYQANNEDQIMEADEEDIVLTLLDNTSKDLEQLDIYFSRISERLYIELWRKVNKKEKLQKLTINSRRFSFDHNKQEINFNSVKTVSEFEWMSRCNQIIKKDLLNSLISVKSLKLDLTWGIEPNYTEMEDIFKILQLKISKNLIKFQLKIYNFKNSEKLLNELFLNCNKLRKLSIMVFNNPENFNFFNLLVNHSHKFVSLNLQFVSIDDNQLEGKQIIFNKLLKKISLNGISFGKNNFKNLLLALENCKMNLKFLSIYECEFDDDELKFFSNYLQNFNYLNFFSFIHHNLDEEILSNLLKSLKSCGKTLEVLQISENIQRNFLQCPLDDVLELFKSCERIRAIKLSISISVDYTVKFLKILKKFQNTLEEIEFRFCHFDDISELCNFLSGCTKLTNLSTLPSKFLIEERTDCLERSKYSLSQMSFSRMRNVRCKKNVSENFPKILLQQHKPLMIFKSSNFLLANQTKF